MQGAKIQGGYAIGVALETMDPEQKLQSKSKYYLLNKCNMNMLQ